MKLKDLLEFNAVGNDRPTPVANMKVSPPLPDELCKDRTYCERKKKKEKMIKKKKLSEMTGFLNSNIQTDKKILPYISYLESKGKNIGRQDGFDIIYSKGNEEEHYYGLKNEEGKVITILLLTDFESINNKNTKQFKFIHTLTKYRNDAMAKRLLFFVKEHENTSIIDYGMQSKDGIDFVKSLGATGRYSMFWYNVNTQELKPYEYKQDKKENTPFRNISKTPWRILIEQSSMPCFERFYLPPSFPGASGKLKYKHIRSIF